MKTRAAASAIATVVFLITAATSAMAQYYTVDLDSQQPEVRHHIPSHYEGNTPYLRARFYANNVGLDLSSSWSMSFWYSEDEDTATGVQIPGTWVSTNVSLFRGETNVFEESGRYYFAISGIHNDGYTKTFGRGTLELLYEPSTDTNLQALLRAVNIDWWTNNVGQLVESNRVAISRIETQKVDLAVFTATNLLYEARFTNIEGRVTAAEADIDALEAQTSTWNTVTQKLDEADFQSHTNAIWGVVTGKLDEATFQTYTGDQATAWAEQSDTNAALAERIDDIESQTSTWASVTGKVDATTYNAYTTSATAATAALQARTSTWNTVTGKVDQTSYNTFTNAQAQTNAFYTAGIAAALTNGVLSQGSSWNLSTTGKVFYLSVNTQIVSDVSQWSTNPAVSDVDVRNYHIVRLNVSTNYVVETNMVTTPLLLTTNPLYGLAPVPFDADTTGITNAFDGIMTNDTSYYRSTNTQAQGANWVIYTNDVTSTATQYRIYIWTGEDMKWTNFNFMGRTSSEAEWELIENKQGTSLFSFSGAGGYWHYTNVVSGSSAYQDYMFTNILLEGQHNLLWISELKIYGDVINPVYTTNAVYSTNTYYGLFGSTPNDGSGLTGLVAAVTAGVNTVVGDNVFTTNTGDSADVVLGLTAAATGSLGKADTAYDWGDHQGQGYLTDELDPAWTAASGSVLYAESDPIWAAASNSYARSIILNGATTTVSEGVADLGTVSGSGTSVTAIVAAGTGGVTVVASTNGTEVTYTVSDDDAGGSGGAEWPAGRTNGTSYMLGSVGTNEAWWTLAEVRDYLVVGVQPPGAIGTNIEALVANGVTTQSWVVPAGVSNIVIRMRGGGGGGYASGYGGAGATVQGWIAVTSLETLSVIIGLGGENSSLANATVPGGWPGGGTGKVGNIGTASGAGGYSALYRGTNLICLAAGGGGSGYFSAGGAGGSLTGQTGGYYTTNGVAGTGGSQTAGGVTNGAALSGGAGLSISGTNAGGGGGGGGKYGGGGGNAPIPTSGGGGGGGSCDVSISLGLVAIRGNSPSEDDYSGQGAGGTVAGGSGNAGGLTIYY